MRVTYLTNHYPAVSHTFIRRELLALERRGHVVDRMSLRPCESALPDPLDEHERNLTTSLLGGSGARLLLRAIGEALRSPGRSLATFGFAIGLARRSSLPLLKMAAYFVEALVVVRLCRERASDLLRVHFGTNGAIVARLARRLGGPPYTLGIHGPDEFDAPDRWDLRGLVAESAFVTAISHYCAAQLMRWAAHSDWPKIEIVHCAVDPIFLEAAPFPEGAARRFCCVARLAPQKGLPLLLDALAQAIAAGADLALDLVGDGPARADLERQAKTLGLTDRVRFLGSLRGTGVRAVIVSSHAMAMASFAEGLPVVLMEAMGLGRPVIATAIAGIPELVNDGESGWLVAAGDVDALADAMIDLSRTPDDELSRLGRAAHKACAAAHEVDAQAVLLDAAIARHVPGQS